MLLSDGGLAGSCEGTSVLLTINNQVVDGLVHRLQVFYIVELYQERQALMLVQITECRLSRHRKAFAKSMHCCCKEWYLILAHILTFSIRKNTTILRHGKKNIGFPADEQVAGALYVAGATLQLLQFEKPSLGVP